MTASKITLQAAHVKQFNDLLRSIEPWQHKTCRITIPEFVPAHNWVVALCANHKFMSLLFHMSPLCKQWVSTPCKVPGAYEHKAHRDNTQCTEQPNPMPAAKCKDECTRMHTHCQHHFSCNPCGHASRELGRFKIHLHLIHLDERQQQRLFQGDSDQCKPRMQANATPQPRGSWQGEHLMDKMHHARSTTTDNHT